jgi:hypothetical protein
LERRATFDAHAVLDATKAFVARSECLIDHPLDVTRSFCGEQT